MNSLKKGEGIPLLNLEVGPGVPLLNFEGGPRVPFLNFRGGGSEVPGPGVLVPLLHHAQARKMSFVRAENCNRGVFRTRSNV